MKSAPIPDSNPPYVAAACAAVAVFALYVLTLAPSTAFWDTSEYIVTAHRLGIPHPPGNPLFVLLAHGWDVLLSPTGLSVAVRINLFSAFMSALAHGCWYLVCDRMLEGVTRDRTVRRIGAGAAVLLSATAFTVWNQSNVNEKVYTVSLFTIALLSWIAMRWRDGVRTGGGRYMPVVALFLLALSVGNHLMAVLAAPALLVLVLMVKPRLLLNWRLYAVSIGPVVLALCVQLFLPIRAAQNPVINEGDPRCDSTAAATISVLTFGRAGCPALSEVLTRRQYGKPSMYRDPVAAAAGFDIPRSPALLAAQVANYMQYFDWQWTRSVAGNDGWFGGVRPLITLLFGILGFWGLWTVWQRDRAVASYMTVLFATLSIGLVFYLNFRYGYNSPWADGGRTNTEVRERDYFFIVSFSLWGLFAGIGLTALWLQLARLITRRGAPLLMASPILALALVPLLANAAWASRSNDYVARDFAYNMLQSVQPYGVLITNGDNDTFPLWYLQEVEGIRSDVTVIVTSYLNTDWYARQLRDLTRPCPSGVAAGDDPSRIICQRPYAQLPPPSRSILDLTDEQIEAIAGTAYYSPQVEFRAGGITSTIVERTPIEPADLFLAQIIKSSIGDRPIHFAITASPSSYGDLGLSEYLVREGLSFRLNNGTVAAGAGNGIHALGEADDGAGPRFVNLPLTESLATETFMHRGGFPRAWNHWPDIATEQIIDLYANTLHVLAYIHAREGNNRRADELMSMALPFQTLSSRRATASPTR